MILNGEDQVGKTLETDVCIVGSGQAGITLAWYLLKKGIKVTILEGSRVFDRNPNETIDPSYKFNENIALYNGESDGVFAGYEKDFLIVPNPTNNTSPRERDRVYGGTSTHWGGQSRPINASTFEARPGFPGWPISRKDLDPYYEETCKFLGYYGPYYKDGIAGYNFSAEFWAKEICNKDNFKLNMRSFDIEMYQGIPPQNKQFQALKVDGKTIGESDARVILNASLLHIDSQSNNVNKLTIGVLGGDLKKPTYNGQQFSITARAYILACGAVANARQLLLSEIGNEYDQVGRHLSSQPISYNVNAISTYRVFLDACASKLVEFNASQEIMDKFGINFLVGKITPTAEALTEERLGSCWFDQNGTKNYYHELLPEKESRITLSDKKDVFNQPKTRATWVLSPKEEENYYTLAKLFEDAVKYKIRITPWNEVKNTMGFNGHHLCTTRMSEKPEDGVVDKNLKVHSMDNLYCAGSSVWTTAGIVNPTFSIIAFSIRLADHLSKKLQSQNI